MSLSVILRRVARAEFDEAAEWYDRRQTGRGTKFTRAVQATLNRVADQPELYAAVHGETREAPVAGYPYRVYSRIDAGRVVVTAVFHTSRDPAVWQSRT